MIKVLQVIGSLNSGGSQSMIMNIYRNIDRKKMQFDFIVDRPDDLLYAEEITELGGKIYFLPQYKLYNHRYFKKSWHQFFGEHNDYKIIHGHVRSTASIYLKIAKKYGLQTISHSHSTSNGKGIGAIIKKVLQYKIRYVADYFIGCSKDSAQWLFGKRKANSNKCIILKNAIDTDKYIYDEILRKKVREEFDVSDGEILIGNIGRFSHMKNHKFLIEIFEKIYEKNNKYKLILVGDGELKEEIRKIVIEKNILDRVVFTGVRRDINRILQAIDIIIMPSKYEGFPVTMVEAQCNGVPCFISDKITSDVCLNSNITKISLNETAEKWATIINQNSITREKKVKEKIIAAGYDVRYNAKWIEKFYENICEKRKNENII